MKRLLYTLSLSMFVPCYGMHSSCAKVRKEEQEKVLVMLDLAEPSDKQLQNIEHIFTQENYSTYLWFAAHARKVNGGLQETTSDATVKIMGSRRWCTNHLLSDIDAVVITEAQDHEKVVDALQNYYTAAYPSVSQLRMKTKAGLSLFVLKNFSDPELGAMKLKYTIQSPQTNTTIVTGMTEKLKTQFPNRFDKVRYACAMMRAVHDKDEAAQLKLKEWTRILPVTESKS